MEYYLIGLMLKEGLDVYVPLVDDHAVDAIVKRRDGSTALIQIKARSSDVIMGNAAFFAAIPHEEVRQNYWFILHSERMNMTWILSSAEFVQEALANKSGKNAGKYALLLNGTKKNKQSGVREEYCKPQYEKYLTTDFSRIVEGV